MATDYIHWIGRLARSHIASIRFADGETLVDIARDDLSFAAGQVLAARNALGSRLDEPIGRVLEDALVLSTVKGFLGGKL
jgi:hypothetical protein